MVERTTRQRIVAVAQRLPQIARLEIEARPANGSRTNWRGQGNATVEARRNDGGDWLFHEAGRMRLSPDPAAATAAGAGNRILTFRNVLRWRLADDCIELAHQRFGAAHEVALVRLVADVDHDAADLVSARAHPCRADLYHARLFLAPDGFDLHWRIQGPEKSELLVHAYRTRPTS